MTVLLVRETHRTLRIARGGRLLPWLGPALRGLTGGRLRAHACVFPVAEQISTRKMCIGCPQMAGCQYGETYEPDPPPGLHLAAGWENTARPIVISPQFPLPELARPGFAFAVRITAIGRTAIGHLDDVWEALRIGGADLAIGLGDDHVLFDVEPAASADGDVTIELPPDESANPAWLPRVRVEFTSPLFIREKDRDVFAPDFGQLMRAGLRTLGPLHKLYAEPLPDDVFARVKAAAMEVPLEQAEFNEFRQAKWSHRTKEGFELVGVTGWAEYGPLPAWLLPWLRAAGRVHVGTHRVAGAGGWRVTC